MMKSEIVLLFANFWSRVLQRRRPDVDHIMLLLSKKNFQFKS